MAQLFTHDVRFQSGGYNPHTQHVQVTVGAVGLIFAPLGMLGVFDGKPSWIRAFYNFQLVQLAVLVMVFASDLVVLRRCENWANSLEAHLRPNVALYEVSRRGLCATARFYYIIGFLVDASVTSYFAVVTRDLCKQIEHGPMYLISFSDHTGFKATLPDHAHVKLYDQSVGEPVLHMGCAAFRPSQLRYSSMEV